MLLAISAGPALFALRAPAIAPSARAVTVTPSDGLLDGQEVTVRWSGYPPGGVQLRQCGEGPRGRVCLPSPVPGVTGPDGRGSTTYRVRAGNLGSFTCDPSNPCSIAVGLNAADGDTVFARITFAGGGTTTTAPPTTAPPTTAPPTTTTEPELDPCPQPERLLRLSGEDAAEVALQRWAALLCQDDDEVPLDFTQINSRGGRHGFIQEFNDVGVSALGFSDEEIDELREQRRDGSYVYIPVLASALVCPFNIQYADLSGVYRRLPRLHLSAEALAGILNATYPNVALHPALDRDNRSNPALPRNPDGSVRPKALKPRARADFAYATWLQTAWFYADDAARRAWERPSGGRFKTGRTESFPAEAGVELRVGPVILAQLVRAVDSEPTAGSIACVDSSVAARHIPDLPVAHLRNALGEYVLPTTESVTKALEHMKRNPDGTFEPRFGRRDFTPGAYPLPTVTYLIVPRRSATDREVTVWVKRLARFALGDGQEDHLPPGYVPLPAKLREAAEEAIREIDRAPATTTTRRGTTTTTTDPGAPLPTDGSGLIGGDSFFSDSGFSSVGDGGTVTDGGATTVSESGGDPSGGSLPARAVGFVRGLVRGDAAPVAFVFALGAALLLAGPALQLNTRRNREALRAWLAARQQAPQP